MATLEKRGDSFRLDFFYGGRRFRRSLQTTSKKVAQGILARAEDLLQRLSLGTVSFPDGADITAFLLTDGRDTQRCRPTPAAPPPLTLTALFTDYFAKLPDGNLEASTIAGMKIHRRQLEKHFGKRFPVAALRLGDLQGYVEKRAKDKGQRGRTVTPGTIKKAIVTLRTVWNWGRQHELIEKPFPSKGLKFPKGKEKPPFMTFSEVARRAAKATLAEAADLWECAFLSLVEIDELLRLAQECGAHACVYHRGSGEGGPIRGPLSPIAGRWAGDRVSLVGDYDSSKLWKELYERKLYRNISKDLVQEWNDFIEIDTMKLRYATCSWCQLDKKQ